MRLPILITRIKPSVDRFFGDRCMVGILSLGVLLSFWSEINAPRTGGPVLVAGSVPGQTILFCTDSRGK